MDIGAVVKAVLKQYQLPLDGYHGVAHWARVLENGLRLCRDSGGDIQVVTLFAVLHDSRRVNESTDPEHGMRAAEFAQTLRGDVFEIEDHAFELLCRACQGHNHERTHPNVTIQTCWDADRLDLGRIGITPHPSRLCTAAGKSPEMISWAHGRASFHVVPEFVANQWQVQLPAE